MDPESLQRRLAAILSADVHGYSRLMGDDEEDTIRTLKSYRDVIRRLVGDSGGRVVDSPGDNLLAEFGSAVNAVRCAAEIQRELEGRNAALPDHRKMAFRIGINLGDVVVEEGALYGDGVNIAARLESLAEPGGVAVSGSVFDQVAGKLPMTFDFRGEHDVKNIATPVRVYRVKTGNGQGEPTGAVALEVPEKPSIAVLPFTNMSGDPEQEYFSDGLTEDLITDLSRISEVFVIARNSAFVYKGKAVDVRDVGRELGVRNVLEGSVRKAGDRVRITAQLVDVRTGGHLWAQRYDRDLNDIFSVQDDVTDKIVTALEVHLTEGERDSATHRGTSNLEAYDYVLRGMELCARATCEDNVEARRMFQHAVDLDPAYAAAYAMLGTTHLVDYSMAFVPFDSRSLEHAVESARRALELAPELPAAHQVLGVVALVQGQHDEAIARVEKAIANDPNNAEWWVSLAAILSWSGRAGEAKGLIKKAMRLDPHYPHSYLFWLGHAHYVLGELEEAVAAFRRCLNRNPDFHPANLFMVAALSELGRLDQAAEYGAKLRGVWAETPLDAWRERLPYRDPALVDRVIGAVGAAELER